MAKKKAIAAELQAEIATTGDGRDITQPWFNELKEYRDPRVSNAVDWGVYERIRKDDQVKSCLEQRFRAVIAAEWGVLSGNAGDPRADEAAEQLKQHLMRHRVDRLTEKMLYAIFYGYSVAEMNWSAIEGLFGWDAIKVKHARRFRFDKDDNLRLLTQKNRTGEMLPERKFWLVTAGGANDDEVYGEGLADWLYWPTLFKRNGIKFWNIFLDKFAMPTAKATYKKGTSKEDIAKVMRILRSMAQDSGFAVPDGIAVEFIQAARNGTGDYKELCRYMDEAIAKIILSQTMTTQDGSSLSQAQVHAGVKLDVVKADADLICESFNAGPARWWTDFNYGPDVAAPQLIRMVEEEADLQRLATVDQSLSEMGWVRSEESFKDTYGDGYERKGKAAPVSGDGKVVPIKKAVSFAATDPRPLYVYRRVTNAADIIGWAKKQGFKSLLPARELHVTIAYSRRPVNWFDVGGSFYASKVIADAGGPRAVDRLGDQGAVVLHFNCSELTWRHKEFVENGASWDFPSYLAHITLTYDPGEVDISKVEPYTGKIELGPEVFEELTEDWFETIQEISYAEESGDAIDTIVSQMLQDNGYTPLEPRLKALIDAIEGAASQDDIDAFLLASVDSAQHDDITQMLARAGFATRIAAESGVE